MNKIDIKKFLEKLKQETEYSGLSQCPFDIVELGNELGLSENLSNQIAEHLVKLEMAEYKALGNSMIQLR